MNSQLLADALCYKEPLKIDPCVERIEPCTVLAPENPKDWELEVLQPTPEEYRDRIAYIRKRPKNVMQQGTNEMDTWILNFHYTGAWENPCMGWTATGDALSPIRLVFNDMEAAIKFCDKLKIKYEIETRKEIPFRFKFYADNFLYKKRRRVSTK